jgi:hypothetical protein
MIRQRKDLIRRPKAQTGIGLVDSIVGVVILLIVGTGVFELFAMALSTQRTQPSAAARTAEFARAKMEQILRSCGGTSHDISEDAEFTGANLAGCDARMRAVQVPIVGGGLDTRHPVARYVDYLDANGNPVPSTTKWQYIRVWEVSIPPSASTGDRQIAVKAQAHLAVANSPAAESTIVTSRSFPLR